MGRSRTEIASCWKASPTTFEYANVGGQSQLLKAVIADGRARSVTYTNDLNGQVLKRDEQDNVYTQGDPHEIWYRFGVKQMGYVGNNGTTDLVYGASVAQRGAAIPSGTPGAFRNGATSGASYSDFDQSYNPINSYEQGHSRVCRRWRQVARTLLSGLHLRRLTSAGYIVRKGDTLAGIAAGLYGDSSALRAFCALIRSPGPNHALRAPATKGIRSRRSMASQAIQPS